MLYRIRSTVGYYWDSGEKSSNKIKELYSRDKTFLKMIRIVQNSVYNLFTGTDKDQTILKLAANKTQKQVRSTKQSGATSIIQTPETQGKPTAFLTQ